MPGWSSEKREKIETQFFAFLKRCYVNSKDYGLICIGDNLWEGQYKVISQIFDALEEDIHDIYVLKSRQLGVSTLFRCLTVFLIGSFPGVKGAIVFDTAENKNQSREELEAIINDLPKAVKFPTIRKTNREGLILSSNSQVLFKSAGVKKSKSSGTLGRSVGLSIAHCSEMCSWDNDEGLQAFRESLSDINENRLYLWESTARGFNQWYEMWNEARKDTTHCKCIFIGWWGKDSQRIERNHPDFDAYGSTPPSDKEAEKIRLVRERYGVEITVEQLAWIRRKMDPTAQAEGDADPEFEGSTTKIQEQPWIEEEAFQQTGAIFFSAEKLTEVTHRDVNPKFNAYFYSVGSEFIDTHIIKAPNAKMAELKVWEEPDPDGYYVIGCDPAFGENEANDRSSIQVARCYADGLDQVAEYASPLVRTEQLAWVLASIMGWYGNGANSQVKYALELNGPGTAVFTELRSLKHQIEAHFYLESQIQERGLKDIFRNVKTYLYTRADAIQGGFNFHIKCLSIDTVLPAVNGWITMGDVKVGDQLFDEAGNPCSVIKTSEIKYGHECYRVTFDDGASIVADAEHLWEVRGCRLAYDKGPELVKTKDLIARQHGVDVTKPLQMADAALPIDPYVLGLWLGDGYSSGGRFCAHADDIKELGAHIKKAGFTLGKVGVGKTVSYQNIYGLVSALKETSLLDNKHIPAAYLRASFSQRHALFQGLMDTDGTINPANGRQCSFSTTNPVLAVGFEELARSLGIKIKHHSFRPKLTYKGVPVECAIAYYFYFTAYPDLPVFRLRRKAKKTKLVGNTRFRRSRRHVVASIERVDSTPVRCIEVDSNSHLYLAGRSMVPTHNTTSSLKITFMERLRDNVSNGKFRVRSMDLVEEMKTIAREGDTIKAPGSMKDDRVLAAAFTVHCWENGPRKLLMASGRTREAEAARQRLTIVDQVNLYQQNQLQSFFARKMRVRLDQRRELMRQNWRGRR